MGLIGGIGNALKYYATPEGLQAIGATLKDISAGGSDNFMALQQRNQQAAMLRQKQAAQAQIMGLYGQPGGGVTAGAPSVEDSVNGAMAGNPIPQVTATRPPAQIPQLSDPNVQRQLLAAQQSGVDIRPIIDMLKGGQPNIKVAPDGSTYSDTDPSVLNKRFAVPTVVNNLITDLGDPKNLERHIPQLGEGMTYSRDASGRATGVQNAPGYVDALGQATEAKSRATAQGSAPYDFINVPGPDGRSTVMAKSQAVGGAFQGQSPQDAVYGSDMAKAAAQQYQGIQTAGTQAPSKIARYKQIAGLLGNYEGGKFAPAGLEIASALNSLGMKMDPKMSNVQAADALGKQLVLDLNGGSLGTGFSNADREFLQGTVPGILQSSGGRNKIISIAVAGEQRKQDVAAKARQWQQRFGRIDAPDATGKTFQDYLDAWAEAHPVFSK